MAAYNKLWVALIMAGVQFARAKYGVDLGVDETTAATLVSLIAAVLVWAVPNVATK